MLCDLTREMILAERPHVARTEWERARGMIGRKFDGFDALILPRCRSIHTWFMGQCLDIVFVDEARRVLGVEARVTPWRIIRGPRGTRDVIELPSGRLCGISIQHSDKLAW